MAACAASEPWDQDEAGQRATEQLNLEQIMALAVQAAKQATLQVTRQALSAGSLTTMALSIPATAGLLLLGSFLMTVYSIPI